MLDTEVPIHDVGGAEVRVHHDDVARYFGSASEPSAGWKNRAVPVEVGARDCGVAEQDGASKGLRTGGSDGYGRCAGARWDDVEPSASSEVLLA